MSGKLNILVALASDVVFDQIRPLVSRSDVEISRVYSGYQALTMAVGSTYDLLVLQHPMADLEFAELFRRIRASDSACCRAPMLILTRDDRLDAIGDYLDGDRVQACCLDAAPEQVQLALTELIGIAMRAKARLAVELSAQLKEESLQLFCQTVNVSEGGMLVRSRSELPIGTRVELILTLPGESESVKAVGEILRRTAPDADPFQGLAIRFLDFEDDGRTRLADFVAEHELTLSERSES